MTSYLPSFQAQAEAGTSSAEAGTWDLPQGNPPGQGGIPQRVGPCDLAGDAASACWGEGPCRDEGGIPLGLSWALVVLGNLTPGEDDYTIERERERI